MSGDAFNRRAVGPDEYQCGCHWKWNPVFGDVLIECPIHAAAGLARLRKFEKERARTPGSGSEGGSR